MKSHFENREDNRPNGGQLEITKLWEVIILWCVLLNLVHVNIAIVSEWNATASSESNEENKGSLHGHGYSKSRGLLGGLVLFSRRHLIIIII